MSRLRLNPASTLMRFQKLRSSRPAPMTRTTASATSDITSPRRTQVRAAEAVDRCPASLSELLTTCSRRCRSGDRPKSDARDQRNGDREQQHDRDRARFRPRSRQALRVRRQQRAQAAKAQHRAERAAGEREHDPLGQELPQQPPAPGAERRADRELALPRLGAGEHQVRQVGARDEQHEPHRALQHPERRAEAADEVVLQPDRNAAGGPSCWARAPPIAAAT